MCEGVKKVSCMIGRSVYGWSIRISHFDPYFQYSAHTYVGNHDCQ